MSVSRVSNTTAAAVSAGLHMITPTSVSVSSGSASVNSSGAIVLNNATNVTVNGAFNSKYKNYLMIVNCTLNIAGSEWTTLQWRSGSTVANTAFYDCGYLFLTASAGPTRFATANETFARVFPSGGYKTTWAMDIYSPFEGLFTVTEAKGGYVTASTWESGIVNTVHKENTSFNGFTLFSNNLFGTISLYGYNDGGA
jgi:hypothetical protein